MEALADIQRCPGCGQIGQWTYFRGRRESRCTSGYDTCRIVYFRADGTCIEMFGETPEVGPWRHWFKSVCGLDPQGYLPFKKK